MAKASATAIEAGEAFVKLTADDTRVNRVLKNFTNRIKVLGSTLQRIGKTTALAGGLMFAPFVAGIVSTLKHMDKLNDIADRMDTTTEAISRLQHAADLSASSIEDIEAANKVLTRSAVAASNGSEEQALAFHKLGRSAEDFLEMQLDEKFILIAETLDGLESPLERSQFLLALFGKNAMQVLPLLKEGADGLRDLFAEADQRGLTVAGDDAKRAAEIMDNFDRVIKEVKGTVIEVGAAFLGFTGDVKEGTAVISVFLRNVRQWIKDNRILVTSIAAVIAIATVAGVTLFAFGLVVSGLAAALKLAVIAAGLLSVAIGLITSPITIITALVVGLIAAFVKWTDAGKRLANQVTSTFANIGETFRVTFRGIIGAIQKGDLEKAWKIAQLGMYAVFLDIVKLLREKWYDFLNFFEDGFYNAANSVARSMLRMVGSIQKSFADIIIGLKEVFDAFTTWGPGKVEADMKKFKEDKVLQEDLGRVHTDIARRKAKFDELMEEQRKVLAGGGVITDKMDREARAWRAMILMSLEEEKLIQGKIKKLHADTNDLREEARKEIENDINARIEGINKEAKAREDARNENQKKRLDGIKDERDAQLRMIEELTKEMNKPEARGLPVAPFPRVKGQPLTPAESLGDSVRGLFNSADFAGALGIGPASEYAKKQVELQRSIVDELRGLRGDVRGLGGEFS